MPDVDTPDPRGQGCVWSAFAFIVNLLAIGGIMTIMEATGLTGHIWSDLLFCLAGLAVALVLAFFKLGRSFWLVFLPIAILFQYVRVAAYLLLGRDIYA